MAKQKKTLNKTQTPISYKGEVNLSIQKNGKIINDIAIKNSGTNILFQQLCLALVGNRFVMPAYLGVGASDADLGPSSNKLDDPYVDVKRARLSSGVVTASTPGNGYTATWRASLSYNAISSHVIKEFGLFATLDNTDMLARVTLPSGVNLNQGETLIVTWSMNLNNTPPTSN